MDDVRPPSPKIEKPPPSRLEPYRLFVIRRDGSGYELVHERLGEFQIRMAAEHGRSVVEEPLPAEDEEAGAVSYTILAPDHRYRMGGAAAGLKALSDDLMPALFKHNGLSSDTDVGTVNGKPAPWTRLVLQKLVQYPPLAKEMMVKLRRVLGCWSQRSVCVDTLVRANSGDYLRLRVCVDTDCCTCRHAPRMEGGAGRDKPRIHH